MHKVAGYNLVASIMTTSRGVASIRTSNDSFTDILGPLRGDNRTSPNGSGEAGDKRAMAEREKRQIYSIHGEQVRFMFECWAAEVEHRLKKHLFLTIYYKLV